MSTTRSEKMKIFQQQYGDPIETLEKEYSDWMASTGQSFEIIERIVENIVVHDAIRPQISRLVTTITLFYK